MTYDVNLLVYDVRLLTYDVGLLTFARGQLANGATSETSHPVARLIDDRSAEVPVVKMRMVLGAILGVVLLGCSGSGPNDPGCNMMMCPQPNCSCLTQRRALSQVRDSIIVSRLRNGDFVNAERPQSTPSTTVSARRQGAQR